VEPNRFLRILRRGWVYVVALALVGVAGGAVASALTDVQYTSTTRLYVAVQIEAGSTTGDLVQGNNFAVQKVLSYTDVVTSPRVLDAVVDDLSLDTTAQDLARDVTAEVQPNSVIISIIATADSAAEAAELSTATADNFSDVVVNQLDVPADGGASPVKVEVLQPAVEPDSPSAPQWPLNLAAGLLIGLVVGVALAVAVGLLDRRVHGRADLTRVASLPVLGTVHTDPRLRRRPLAVRDDPSGPTAEELRTLRTNVQSVGFEGGARSLVVTSPLESAEKSAVVANLALSLADAGSNVIVVDADLRTPRLATLFDVARSGGLSEVLTRRSSLDDAIRSAGPRLAVLSAGAAVPNPSELLGSAEMASVTAALASRFDYVLIDAAPVLPVTDAAVLSRLAGATVLEVGAGRVRDDEIAAALESLDDAGGATIGAVLTSVPVRGPDAGAYRVRRKAARRGASDAAVVPTARADRGQRRTTATRGRAGQQDDAVERRTRVPGGVA